MISTSARGGSLFISATSRSTGCHATRTTDPQNEISEGFRISLWHLGPIAGWVARALWAAGLNIAERETPCLSASLRKVGRSGRSDLNRLRRIARE